MQGSVLEICKRVLQCFAYANVLGDLVSGKSIYSFAIHCSVCDDQLYFQLHTFPPPAVSCPFFRENRISIRQTHHAAIAKKNLRKKYTNIETVKSQSKTVAIYTGIFAPCVPCPVISISGTVLSANATRFVDLPLPPL